MSSRRIDRLTEPGGAADGKVSTMPPSSAIPVVLTGIAGSKGVAIGRAVVVNTGRVGAPHRHISSAAVDEEMVRFDAAVAEAAAGLRVVAQRIRDSAARAEASILEAYILMVEDELLREGVLNHVREDHQCAEWALENAVARMSDQLRRGGDPYLAERSHDFEFVADRILKGFTGREKALSLPDLGEPAVLVAHDFSPAETAALTKATVAALVTEIGTRTSHTAILARALEIPAVVGVRNLLSLVGTGDHIVVEGARGRVTVAPTSEMVTAANERAERRRQRVQGRHEERDRPAATRCGVPITLRANIELPSEAKIAVGEGAQGIGLYRTEFLFVDRADLPDEEEQYETYRSVLEEVSPLPVTLRTFDIGGDKFVSAFQAPDEMNPALGLRAVRLGLSRPEIFSVQLRAMARASAHGALRIMVPMISVIPEFLQVRKLISAAFAEVKAAGHAVAENVPVGAMVEVPSAAVMADLLAREAEFLSIGTNDLVQYALAVDRSNQDLAYLASPLEPAIIRLISGVIAAARQSDRPVAVCGAMASDPLAALLLLGMGLRELSMEASSLGEVKEALARVTVAEAEAVALAAASADSADRVETLLKAAFAERLGDLLDDSEP